jgi:hypothetical protein
MLLHQLAKKVTKSLEYRGRRALDGILRAKRVSMSSGIAGEVVRVEQFLPEGDSEYELYQKYFQNSLREFVRVIQTKSLNGFALQTTHVGQYLFHLRDGGVRKVAIDAHDHRDIRSQAIYDWSDIYFKSNRWPGIDYGPKILPIPTGNAGITLENCRYLRGLRGAKKELDLIFVGRIWAGGDANVEHNLRLFENLAKLNCRSKLLAVVFNFDKKSEEFQIIARRLNEAGVEMTDRQVRYDDLMKMSAASKLVVLRAGISGCIAWRMIDMLAMGSCLVLDQAPFPAWPVPLLDGMNFLSFGLRITQDCGPAPLEDYERIVSQMEMFLNEEIILQKIGENNARYFDEYAHPFKVAQYVLEKVKEHR